MVVDILVEPPSPTTTTSPTYRSTAAMTTLGNLYLSHETLYFPPFRTSRYTDLSYTIQNAVSVLNTLTQTSTSAWRNYDTDYLNACSNLTKSEAPFRKHIRHLALRSDPKASTLERIKLETEMDVMVRMRSHEIKKMMQMEHGIVKVFEEVDGFRAAGKLACKELEHAFVLCERAGMKEGEALSGGFLMRVGLGGKAKALKDVRFQDGGGEVIDEMTLTNARLLKTELERRMQVVHLHLLQCREETTALSQVFMADHGRTTDEVKAYRNYMAEKDARVRTEILDSLKRDEL
ncbi:hypothetical protein P280DRAFT_282954 [Massarina eburnea CBS 473.64]|uniref:Uncharacterized protein n=1 Tax=Massarina eburnea CBS 473.64 TaxID=1395130 RepID=A0A6A6S3K2_9PLEO|nr:hypothetical protein P280DRAFT_282954 [Massarina eburnea CBS 473.64]